MTTVGLSIDGMSCGHCVAAVKQALESVPDVVVRDVRIGTATVETDDPATIDAIKAAIEDAGYFAEVVTR
jgi:copper chaperone